MAFLNRVQRADGRKLKFALVVVVFAIAGLAWFSLRTSMTFNASDTALTISYKNLFFLNTTYEVNYADVQQVVLYPTAPRMHKDFGSNMGQTRTGTFSTTELGQFKAAISDINRPLLYIKTKDRAYMISPDDAAVLKQTIESKMAR